MKVLVLYLYGYIIADYDLHQRFDVPYRNELVLLRVGLVYGVFKPVEEYGVYIALAQAVYESIDYPHAYIVPVLFLLRLFVLLIRIFIFHTDQRSIPHTSSSFFLIMTCVKGCSLFFFTSQT